ncbi:MAG: phosphate butyryltransferase [Planctomycetes bacterium]|nr:phosphate butyryltransferase [Planctomycetota bacterium]
MKNFDDIISQAKRAGGRRVAIAGPSDGNLQKAVAIARETGLADCKAYDQTESAVAAVRAGDADLLLKGGVETKTFMGAILDKQDGLRSEKLVSHIAVLEVRGRLILVTDSGICLAPTLEDKVEIIRNAIPLAGRLGMIPAKVAILAAVEKPNPKMPETLDAEKLARMDIPGCVIQGPLAVDNAMSVEAARAKGVSGPVAGQADVLIVPSVLVGNIFCKGIMYSSDCRFGGVVAGTTRPAAFLSRADTVETKLNTIALGILMTQENRNG